MRNILLIIFIKLFFCTAGYTMEREKEQENPEQEPKPCFAFLYEKVQKLTNWGYEEVLVAPKDDAQEYTSCAYNCGKYHNWPTLCSDEYEPGLLMKIPFVAAGISSCAFLCFGSLVGDKTLLICGAALSPSIPCCVFIGAGFCASNCANALDKQKFLADFEKGQKKGFKDTSCRKCVDATCDNFYEILKKISEPCFGESSGR